MKKLGMLLGALSLAGMASAATYQCELRGHIAHVTLDPTSHTLQIDNEWGRTAGLYVTHARHDGQYDHFAMGSLYGPHLSINRTRTDDVQFRYCWGCDPYICRAE